MKEKIQTDRVPQAIGPYSQAIKINNLVYFSGQIPLDPKTMQLVSNDFALQAEQVFTNLSEMAKAAGGNLNQLIKLTVFLVDLTHFPLVNEVMVRYLSEPYPARTTIQVSALPKDSQIEVEAIMDLS